MVLNVLSSLPISMVAAAAITWLGRLISLRMILAVRAGSDVNAKFGRRYEVSYMAGKEPPSMICADHRLPQEAESALPTDFKAFVELTYAQAMRAARHDSLTREDGEDLVHDAYAAMLKRWETYQTKSFAELRKILRRAVRNHATSRHRRRKVAALTRVGYWLVNGRIAFDSADERYDSDLYDVVADVTATYIDQLPRNLREIAHLLHYEGLTADKITEQLGERLGRDTIVNLRAVQRYILLINQGLRDALLRAAKSHPDLADHLRSLKHTPSPAAPTEEDAQ